MSFSSSLPVNKIWSFVSSKIVRFLSTATGASFIGLTLILTVAILESIVPSLTLKVKLSSPLKFSFGIYVRFGTIPLSFPYCGCETI